MMSRLVSAWRKRRSVSSIHLPGPRLLCELCRTPLLCGDSAPATLERINSATFVGAADPWTGLITKDGGTDLPLALGHSVQTSTTPMAPPLVGLAYFTLALQSDSFHLRTSRGFTAVTS